VLEEMQRFNVYLADRLVAVVHAENDSKALESARAKVDSWFDRAKCYAVPAAAVAHAVRGIRS
jgi:hypothetical protein